MEKFPSGREEKEKRVCEIIRQGKGVREIASIERLNFTQIKKIRRKYFNVDDEDNGRPSKRSQALKLIREGKTDVDIAMELDLSAKEMLEYRKEYLILNDDDDLLRLYQTAGGDLPSLLTLYREMKIEDISAEEAIWALSQYRTFKHMNLEYESLLRKLLPLRKLDMVEKENLELTRENRKLLEIFDAIREGFENSSEETSASSVEINSMRKPHRRRPIRDAKGQERPEDRTFDRDPTRFFGSLP